MPKKSTLLLSTKLSYAELLSIFDFKKNRILDSDLYRDFMPEEGISLFILKSSQFGPAESEQIET